jgi:hypothetical protein
MYASVYNSPIILIIFFDNHWLRPKPERKKRHFKCLTELSGQRTKLSSLEWEEILIVNECCILVYTMEPLLCECEHCSESLWRWQGDIDAEDVVPRVELGKHNVIFNIPRLSPLLHIHDKSTRSVFLWLTKEIKINVIYRCMCSKTMLTGESRFHISTTQGIWTQVPWDGKQRVSPLD